MEHLSPEINQKDRNIRWRDTGNTGSLSNCPGSVALKFDTALHGKRRKFLEIEIGRYFQIFETEGLFSQSLFALDIPSILDPDFHGFTDFLLGLTNHNGLFAHIPRKIHRQVPWRGLRQNLCRKLIRTTPRFIRQ